MASSKAASEVAAGPSVPGLRLPVGARRLALRLRRGERGAFEQVFRDHHQEIYRYCHSLLRDRGDAEDALQATMAAALRSLPGEGREIAIRPWLFRVAHNESISILRSRRERPSTEPELDPVVLGSSASEDLERRERLRTLLADLRSLPERQRSALVMRELSDLSYPEIAAVLGCREGAARQTVHEARSALELRKAGREMACEQVRLAIDDGDRRRLRGRRVQAHLQGCESCANFQAAIEARREDLRALCPTLPLAAGGGILAGLIGGGSAKAAGAAGAGASATAAAGTGSAVGGAGAIAGGLAGGAAIKGASVAAAVVIAAGAAEGIGAVDLPGPVDLGLESSASIPSEPGPAGGAEGGTAGTSAGAAGKPGSERAREARTRGVEASSLRGANRSAKAKGRANGAGPPAKRGKGSGGERGKPDGIPGRGTPPSQPGSSQGGSKASPPVTPPAPVAPAPAVPGGSGATGGGPPPDRGSENAGAVPVTPAPAAPSPGGKPER